MALSCREGKNQAHDRATLEYLPLELALEAKQFNPTNTFVYGQNVVLVTWGMPVTAVMIRNNQVAETYREHFQYLWKIALLESKKNGFGIVKRTSSFKKEPFEHEDLELWRSNFKGIRYLYELSNLLVTGAIDDIWIDEKGELIIVDYKSTSKEEKVSLDKEWQIGYKRQMEIYQWLFRQNGFKVNQTGYFVYCNGKTDREAFDAKLEFDIDLIPYKGDDKWIPQTLKDIKICLDQNEMPKASSQCDYCSYRKASRDAQMEKREKTFPKNITKSP